MARKKRDTPCGNVVFGEDLRLEAGNKFSIMGVPMGPIMLPGFPVMIRLALMVSYMEHEGESDDPVTILVRAPGNDEPVHRADIDTALLRSERPPGEVDPNDPVIGATTAFSIPGLLLTEAGYVEVTALRGSTEVKLGRHQFIAAPAPEESPPNPDTPPA